MAAQIGAHADTLEGCVERRLRNSRVSERLENPRWDGLTPSQVDDLSGCPVNAVTKQEDAERLVFGVPVHTRGGEVGGTEGLKVQGERAHWVSYL